jgi:hypothetical protein
MHRRKLIFKSSLIILFSIGLFAFQEKQEKPLNSEAAIEARLQAKINQLKSKQYWECQKKALQVAIPKADSMIAEMYARDLRANDIFPDRPDRPDRPQVEIEPFPFDRIE